FPISLAIPLLLGCGRANYADHELEAHPGDTGPDDATAANVCQSPALQLFDAAVCVCGDLDEVGRLTVVGDIGVNGYSKLVANAEVDGNWHAQLGLEGATWTSIDGDLTSAGQVSWVGDLAVAGDLSAMDVDGVGELEVVGAARVGGQFDVVGESAIGSEADYAEPAGPPCGCDQPLDIAAAVAAASEHNDNRAVGLPTTIEALGTESLTLATGSYYLDSLAGVGELDLIVDGQVSLFVEGSIASVGAHSVTLVDGATLELYVSGGIASVGALELGTDPSALRLYVGGDQEIELDGVGDGAIAGLIYAPEATLSWVGDLQVHGAIFARDLDSVGDLEIVYVPADRGGDSCPPEDGDEDGETDPIE
ncbi:MAG: hypothetical protein KJO07_10235, partial [Deltaproteobacteria bacterium]|nr:hypothetical protein [Deltaproteobacteria bacterium]